MGQNVTKPSFVSSVSVKQQTPLDLQVDFVDSEDSEYLRRVRMNMCVGPFEKEETWT